MHFLLGFLSRRITHRFEAMGRRRTALMHLSVRAVSTLCTSPFAAALLASLHGKLELNGVAFIRPRRAMRSRKLLLPLIAGCALALDFAPPISGQVAPEPKSGTDAVAPAAPEALPSLKDILEKNERAEGGGDAWQRITSLSMRGIYQTQDSSAFIGVEILEKAPDKSLYKLKFPNDVIVRDVSDGKTAWIEDAKGACRDYKGAALASRLRRSNLADHSKLILLAATGKVLGMEKIGSHSVYVVEYSPAKDTTSRLYFDADTGFVVREEEMIHSPEGSYAVLLDMEDYRDVEGLKIPFRMKRVEKGAVFNIRITQVKLNPPVDDSAFAKPESASASR